MVRTHRTASTWFASTLTTAALVIGLVPGTAFARTSAVAAAQSAWAPLPLQLAAKATDADAPAKTDDTKDAKDASGKSTEDAKVTNTVIWLNGNGKELDRKTYKSGEKEPTTKKKPTKDADKQYTYTFDGWDKGTTKTDKKSKDKNAKQDKKATEGTTKTYKPTFKKTVRSYEVTFVDEDGTVLQTDEVAYGKTPSYNGSTPTKDETDEYSFEFVSWSPNVSAVDGEATYTATYDATEKTVNTVIWMDGDGTELDRATYGEDEAEPTTSKQATKAPNDQYTYCFTGWDNGSVEKGSTGITTTYLPQFDEVLNEYTVSFVDEGGAELQSTTLAYGETPAFEGKEPTKAGDGLYAYAFAGWTPQIATVTGAATYVATFTETFVGATVTFEPNGASGEATTQQLAKKTATALDACPFTAPQRTSFDGWNTKADGTGTSYQDKEQVTLTDDLTLYAQWKANPGTIEASTDTEGTGVSAAGLDTMAKDLLTADEQKLVEGGADAKVTLTVQALDEKSVAKADKTALEAYAKKEGCTVGQYFDISLTKQVGDQKATALTSTPQDLTLTVSIPTDLKASNRTFTLVSCHDKKVAALGTGKGDAIAAKMSSFSTVALVYEDAATPAPQPTTYTVTFNVNGRGTKPAVQVVESGKTATKPADLKVSGWTFGGWYTDSACKSAYDFATPVTANITLYAKWTKVQATPSTTTTTASLTFNLAGGKMNGKTSSVTYTAKVGDTINLPSAPTRDGYTFLYWDSAQYKAGSTYKVTGNHTFVAKWEQKATQVRKSNLPQTSDPSANLPAGLIGVVALVGVGFVAAGVTLRKRHDA